MYNMKQMCVYCFPPITNEEKKRPKQAKCAVLHSSPSKCHASINTQFNLYSAANNLARGHHHQNNVVHRRHPPPSKHSCASAATKLFIHFVHRANSTFGATSKHSSANDDITGRLPAWCMVKMCFTGREMSPNLSIYGTKLNHVCGQRKCDICLRIPFILLVFNFFNQNN